MADKNETTKNILVTADMLQDLPGPVQRYLNGTGVVGKPWVNSVLLHQTGRFRQGPDQPWMSMTAEQRYTTDPPSFIWNASFKIVGLPLLRARDEYQAGHGHMFGKMAGLFTIFDVRGEELDQGAMLRYLSEMIWFPSAFLGENISWKGLVDNTAQVTFTDQGKSVSGQMHFDQKGRFRNFTTERYRAVGEEFSLDPWSTPVDRYGVLASLNLPVHGQAVWNLASGDFAYVDLEITKIEYNSPA